MTSSAGTRTSAVSSTSSPGSRPPSTIPACCPFSIPANTWAGPYLVMPYIDGADLARQLNAQALTVGRVLVLLRQVADGLDAMHGAGVLHLDVKPANVLVGRVHPA